MLCEYTESSLKQAFFLAYQLSANHKLLFKLHSTKKKKKNDTIQFALTSHSLYTFYCILVDATTMYYLINELYYR